MKCDVETRVLPTPKIRLFHSPKKCAKYLERHGCPFEPIAGADAETWTITDESGCHAVVLYDARLDTAFQHDISLLAHEAVHVAIYAFECIGERNPAEEERCYMVQAILHELVCGHFAWKERKLGKSREEAVGRDGGNQADV